MSKTTAARATDIYETARENPYVQRLIEDDDLRQNLWQAYESARDAAARLGNGKSPTKQIFDDKKLQKDLKEAAESFRDAAVSLREAPKRRRGGFGRVLLLGLVGTGLAFVLWFGGIRRLPTAAPPLLGLAAPITGAILGWAVLGQSLSPMQLTGFVITLAAIGYGALGANGEVRVPPPSRGADRLTSSRVEAVPSRP